MNIYLRNGGQSPLTSPRGSVVLSCSQPENGVVLHPVVSQCVDLLPASLHHCGAILISQDHVLHRRLQILYRKWWLVAVSKFCATNH